MSNNCDVIAIGKPLTNLQQTGFNWVAQLHGGRDVVFAIDLTESVGINDAARINLRQIVKDSLNKGDTVYILPFATNVDANVFANPLTFTGKDADIEAILKQIPQKADQSQSNTDIQQAEGFIYPQLAQINRNRFDNNQPVKPQSIVWLTDAPLFTPQGITSDVWIETPANSPFRDANSCESQTRQEWLNHLAAKDKARDLPRKNYTLTVVDLPANAQEFCTPAPGGKETCLVNAYLVRQLWLPSVIGSLFILVCLICGILGIKYLINLQKTWKLEIELDDQEGKIRRSLQHQKTLKINEGIDNIIGETRCYLKREGNKLYIEPNKSSSISYKGKEVTKKQLIESNSFRLTYLSNNREHEIKITIKN